MTDIKNTSATPGNRNRAREKIKAAIGNRLRRKAADHGPGVKRARWIRFQDAISMFCSPIF